MMIDFLNDLIKKTELTVDKILTFKKDDITLEILCQIKKNDNKVLCCLLKEDEVLKVLKVDSLFVSIITKSKGLLIKTVDIDVLTDFKTFTVMEEGK